MVSFFKISYYLELGEKRQTINGLGNMKRKKSVLVA